jgi:hypothetical protein
MKTGSRFIAAGDKLSIKALLCNNILYSWQWRVSQQNRECIVLFPLQRRLGERAEMLRYSYITTFVE